MIRFAGGTNGTILENALRDAVKRRKTSQSFSQYEDVYWPRPLWFELWNELKSQGGVDGNPDSKLPIHIKTALFTLRIFVLPEDRVRQ